MINRKSIICGGGILYIDSERIARRNGVRAGAAESVVCFRISEIPHELLAGDFDGDTVFSGYKDSSARRCASVLPLVKLLIHETGGFACIAASCPFVVAFENHRRSEDKRYKVGGVGRDEAGVGGAFFFLSAFCQGKSSDLFSWPNACKIEYMCPGQDCQ